MPNELERILDEEAPALLIGNGINRYGKNTNSSWEDLLAELARKQGLGLGENAAAEMSNTEYFDILDLANPKSDRSNLQEEFCKLMGDWVPGDHHTTIVGWAQRHGKPIVTVWSAPRLTGHVG
jgi:hypothetical protein